MPKGQWVNIFSLANRSAILGLTLLLLAACGGGGGSESSGGASNGGGVVLQAITVTPTDPTLAFGKTLQFVATGTYSDGSTRDISSTVIWGSSVLSVTQVSASGLVSSARIGTSTVEALSGTVEGSTTVVVTGGTATESILHTFFGPQASDGLQPSNLLQAGDGNFYGTTLSGGNSCLAETGGLPIGCGTVFKITPDGVETVLYLFGASPSDGWGPSGLIQATDGNFYGTTSSGGAHGAGTFFKLTPAGVETALYSFGASPSDGVTPSAPIQASDGNYYGTTASGGSNYCAQIPGSANNCGTVFKITPAGVETVLHSFGASASDGVEPMESVIQASDGNFYGTTSGGGANSCGTIPGETHNCGTVFKITPAGIETVLYSFGASPADGFAPLGQLIQATDGNLYGTTPSGGGLSCSDPNSCGGTVFRITLSGVESILYRFASSLADEGIPSQILFQASDGNFYGTTVDGGPYENPGGIAYQITPDGVETTLYSFGASESDGIRPMFLMQARDGNLYGVTDSGGGEKPLGGVTVVGGGTVFKLTP